MVPGLNPAVPKFQVRSQKTFQMSKLLEQSTKLDIDNLHAERLYLAVWDLGITIESEPEEENLQVTDSCWKHQVSDDSQ